MRFLPVLTLLLLTGCITNLPDTDALYIGMTKAEALHVMRQHPRRTSAIGDVQALHFYAGPSRALVGDPEPFVIYIHQGVVTAFGHPDEFTQDPGVTVHHQISGGQTNKQIFEVTPTPAPLPAAKPKPIQKNRA